MFEEEPPQRLHPWSLHRGLSQSASSLELSPSPVQVSGQSVCDSCSGAEGLLPSVMGLERTAGAPCGLSPLSLNGSSGETPAVKIHGCRQRVGVCLREAVTPFLRVSELFLAAANLCGAAVSSVFLAQRGSILVFILMLFIYHTHTHTPRLSTTRKCVWCLWP